MLKHSVNVEMLMFR